MPTIPYVDSRDTLFLHRLDLYLDKDDPARVVDALVESLDTSEISKLFSKLGRPSYDPKMMLKVILLAYSKNIWSCRGIEEALRTHLPFIWLAGKEAPSYVTINRFRNLAGDKLLQLFGQFVLQLAQAGRIDLKVQYLDGTKIESRANRFTIVWRKNVERNLDRIQERVAALIAQIAEFMRRDDGLTYEGGDPLLEYLEEPARMDRFRAEDGRAGDAADGAQVPSCEPLGKTATGDDEKRPSPRGASRSARPKADGGSGTDSGTSPEQRPAPERKSITPEWVTAAIAKLEAQLADAPDPTTSEERQQLRKLRKLLRELKAYLDKLITNTEHLRILGNRNSYSRTDPSATAMRMKEDEREPGRPRPGHSVQITTSNQYITHVGLFPNPTDTLTLIPFLRSFEALFGALPETLVADAGYGSEENYRFLEESGVAAYVPYPLFRRETRPRYQPDPFHPDSLPFNEAEDAYTCPMGQPMKRVGTSPRTTANGYRSESAVYQAQGCEGCPIRERCCPGAGNRTIKVNHRLKGYKEKAKERLTSEEGETLRRKRSVEPESAFGQIKHNMGYRRFRHFGLERATMDMILMAFGANIRRLCSDRARERKKGKSGPPGGPESPAPAPNGGHGAPSSSNKGPGRRAQ